MRKSIAGLWPSESPGAPLGGPVHGAAGRIPGDPGLGLGERHEFRRIGVIVRARLAGDPFGHKIDHDIMGRAFGLGKALEHVEQSQDPDLDPGFLAHFAGDGVVKPLAIIDLAAGDRPLAFQGLASAPDNEDLLAAKHDSPDTDNCAGENIFPARHLFLLLFLVMCGRFYLNSTPAEVAKHFGAPVRDNFPPRYNIAPTQPVAAIRMSVRHAREYALMRWGFVPSWAKGEFLANLAKRPLINARAETVLEKASFKNAFRRRRCLVPADGFYEWQARPAKAKQPYAVHKRKGGLIGLAGIWETAVDPDGGEIDTLAILTAAAGPDMMNIHSREPVVIAPQSYKLWLEADERDMASLEGLIAPAPEGFWAAHPVSTDVNSPRHDGPHLIEPLAA